jgi:hypothetical protein
VSGLEASLSTHYFTFQENNMKNFRSLSAALVLTLVLAAPASAGHIECGIAPPTPPAATSDTTEPDAGSVDGHIEIGVAATDSVVTEAALSLLESVLALF